MHTRIFRTAMLAAAASAAALITLSGGIAASAAPPTHSASESAKPIPAAGSGAATAVLVHGAFADSSSWAGTITALDHAGYDTVAFADPLRGVANDAEALQSFIDTIEGPIVLVGHSYAGMVISQVAAQDADVVGLVYVAAFIPEVGESVNTLNSMYEGSQLIPENLHFAPAPGGLTDAYINQDAYGTVYAGGLKRAAVQIAAATQRPVTAEALAEPATAAAPADIPKWMIVATADNAVPTKIQEFMADRAGAKVTKVDSGHDVPAARPITVARVIAEAAHG